MSLHTTEGKSTIATLLAVVLFVSLGFILGSSEGGQAGSVQATSTATTSVKVLNRPPTWVISAYELYASATSTPTNSGTSTVWTARAEDANSEDYYLLICSASTTPGHPFWLVPNDDPTPRCGNGSGGTTLANQWALSARTTSNTDAIASTTTTENLPFAEVNDWYAYICDHNTSRPVCHPQMRNGHQEGVWPPTATSSPFVVNRRPAVTAVPTNNSPTLPGNVVTWEVTVQDADTVRGGDTLQVHICRTQAFSTTTLSCTGGTWATSSLETVAPATPETISASTTIPIPMQDATTTSYIYVVDTFGHRAVTYEGYNTPLGILNAAPYVLLGSIALFDVFGTTTNDYVMNLRVPEGQTNNFVLQFTVNDDNGCKNTLNNNEITAAFPNVFRTGATCYNSGHYNPNNCYPHANGSFTPWTCYQTSTSTCTALVATAQWECTYSLWYVADPTDDGSVFANEGWKAAIRAEDDDGDTGLYATSTATSTLEQFLAFRATGSPIAYGSWEPNDGTDYHPATTTLYAIGNTGLNQRLDGTPMCTLAPGPGCTMNGTSTIWANMQRYSTTSSVLPYGNPGSFALATSSQFSNGEFVEITLQKTSTTTEPRSADTYWGIFVPNSITYAGDYYGTNFIYGEIAPSGEW